MTTTNLTQQLITAIEKLEGKASAAALDSIEALVAAGADADNNDVWQALLKKDRADVAEILFDAGVSPDKKIFNLGTTRLKGSEAGVPLVLAAIELRAADIATMAIRRDCDIGLKKDWCVNLFDFIDSKSDRFDSAGKNKVKQALVNKGLYPGVKSPAQDGQDDALSIIARSVNNWKKGATPYFPGH